MNQAAQSSTLVLLIRHGQTTTTEQVLPGGPRVLHSSEPGTIQRLEVAGRLAGVQLAAVYSAPMERAQETAAQAVAAHLEPLLVDACLTGCVFGAWSGRLLSELDQMQE